MGGGKKHKGNPLHNRRPSNVGNVSAFSHSISQHASISSSEDDPLMAVLVEEYSAFGGTLPYFKLYELFLLMVVMLSAIVLSGFLGVVTLTSLTIHYNLQEEKIASMVLRSQSGALPPPALVLMSSMSQGKPIGSTLSDTQIASVDDSGMERYFIETSPETGKQTVFMVVEESLHLNATSEDHRKVWDERRERFAKNPPPMDFYQWTRVHPRVCSDGSTIGYKTWNDLKAVIQEANAFSAERFVRNSAHFAKVDVDVVTENAFVLYEDQILITICPNAVLKASYGPIFVNTENIRIECNGCSIETGGSHLSFGPYARDVLIRGIYFKNAVTSSLVFYYDGAEVYFEDCRWLDNEAVHSKVGSVADVNSSSIAHFYRCAVGKRTDTAAEFVSALSIRTS
jgi:hypothetical protein